MQVRITSTRRFTGDNNQLFGPGVWTVPDNIGQSLIASGRATLIPESGMETESKGLVPPLAPKVPLTKPTAPQSDIPVDFPERDVLIANGITTVEQLKAEGIKVKVEAITGFTPEAVTQVGLAIIALA